jgi:hypothetical protein
MDFIGEKSRFLSMCIGTSSPSGHVVYLLEFLRMTYQSIDSPDDENSSEGSSWRPTDELMTSPCLIQSAEAWGLLAFGLSGVVCVTVQRNLNRAPVE